MLSLYGRNTEMTNWTLPGADFSFELVSNNKFPKDKLLFENASVVIGFDGLVLNKEKVIGNNSWQNYFLKDPENLASKLNNLRGTFNGFIYEKTTQRLRLFNDPCAAKNFAYEFNGEHFIFASSTWDLDALCDFPRLLDSEAVYCFLAYGYLFSEMGWTTNSQQLPAGSILTFQNKKVTCKKYKNFVYKQNHHRSKAQTMATLEAIFEATIKEQFQKDTEENYQSFTTLSGGLDSRVTALYGYELGYKNQVAFTCSQKGYDDEIIAREIATDYGFKHHFYPMDGLEYLYDPTEMMRKIGGTCDYNNPAHVVYGIEQVWQKNFGLIHTGHLGGMILGSYISSKEDLPPDLQASRVDPELLPVNKDWEASRQAIYQNEGHFKISERGLNSIAAGVWGLEHLSYNIAPFTHADFIDFALTIPYDLIYKRQVYLEWLNRYHPKWTKYRWEHLHARPTRLWMARHDLWYLRLRFGWRKLLSKKFRQTFDMAPEQYWFEQKPNLKNFLVEQTLPLLKAIKPLDIPYFEVIEKMAQSKEVQLRVRALSLLLFVGRVYRLNGN